jgi:pimeloyl-ACP methyl ester carboxylesterase
MATFVMIHGAWHGGWCFDYLRPLLEQSGHAMIAPDLPGMGGSDAELAAVTLAGWADFVAEICRKAQQPVILVGHSRGGIVISEAAERVPDSMAALVYVCAILLPSGMSRATWRERAEPNPAFSAIQKEHRSGHARVIDTAHAAPVFAQLSPPDLVKSALDRLVAEPDGPRTDLLSLSEARYGSVPRHYIECLHDRTIPIADQRLMQSLSPVASVITLEADHSPFLSVPHELAAALLGIAKGIMP